MTANKERRDRSGTRAAVLFGHDFFISFTLGPGPRGTQSYASDLARRLRERDFTVFFSEDEAPPGAELDTTLQRALQHTRVLVVVVNDAALTDSKWIPEEVKVFRASHPKRPVVPINIGDTLERFGAGVESWLGYEKHIWLCESTEAVLQGIVTPAIVDRLAITPRSMKANSRLRWAGAAIMTALVTLTVVAWLQSVEARTQRDEAVSRQLAAQAVSDSNGNWARSLLQAAAAFLIADSFEARSALFASVSSLPTRLSFLSGHMRPVRAVAFSPDGKLLASGSEDGTVILWDVQKRQAFGRPLKGHAGSVLSVAFNSSGSLLASGGADGTVIFWDTLGQAPSGSILRLPSGFDVSSIAFNPSGTLLASPGPDDAVILWDVAQRATTGPPLKGHHDPVRTVAFSPDGAMLASSGEDGMLILWDVASRRPLRRPSMGHHNTVVAIAFSPDGRLLASGSADETVVIWKVATGEAIGQPLKGHASLVMSVAFSPDSRTLASSTYNGRIVLWNVADPTQFYEPLGRRERDGISSVAFSPNGRLLASGSGDGAVILSDVLRESPLMSSLPTDLEDLFSVAFSPDGKLIATGTGQKTVLVWNARTGEPYSPAIGGHDDIVVAVAFSPNGKLLASGDLAGQIVLTDITSGQTLGPRLWAHKGSISLAFSPDGALLVSAGADAGDTGIVIWDVASGKPMGRPLIIDGGNVLALALSPDGKFLVSGDGQGAVRLWDIKRRQPVGDIMRTPSAVHGVAFSPSGALLAVTDTSRTVFFWDVAGRRQLEPLNLSQAAILSVAFSPDGRLLALGSGQLDRGLVNKVNIDAQNKLILVDVESRRPLGEIQRSWPVFGISFSPDSKHLASAGGLDAARIWSIDVESWREIACSTANRNFSRKEWRQFVGNGVGFRSICPELPEAFN